MGNLDALLIADMANVVLADFGETITYAQTSGPTVTIQAIVHRELASSINNGSVVNDLEIEIANHPTLGVQTVVKMTDIVTLPLRIGAAAVPLKVVAIVAQDVGYWRLRLK